MDCQGILALVARMIAGLIIPDFQFRRKIRHRTVYRILHERTESPKTQRETRIISLLEDIIS